MRTRMVWIALLVFVLVSFPTKGEERTAGFEPPRVLSTVEANYPATAVQGGTVVLEVSISSSGAVGNIQVLQGAKGFTQQAIETVRKWKFAPARLDGTPVTASIPVAFSFSQPIVWWNHQKQ